MPPHLGFSEEMIVLAMVVEVASATIACLWGDAYIYHTPHAFPLTPRNVSMGTG